MFCMEISKEKVACETSTFGWVYPEMSRYVQISLDLARVLMDCFGLFLGEQYFRTKD